MPQLIILCFIITRRATSIISGGATFILFLVGKRASSVRGDFSLLSLRRLCLMTTEMVTFIDHWLLWWQYISIITEVTIWSLGWQWPWSLWGAFFYHCGGHHAVGITWIARITILKWGLPFPLDITPVTSYIHGRSLTVNAMAQGTLLYGVIQCTMFVMCYLTCLQGGHKQASWTRTSSHSCGLCNLCATRKTGWLSTR